MSAAYYISKLLRSFSYGSCDCKMGSSVLRNNVTLRSVVLLISVAVLSISIVFSFSSEATFSLVASFFARSLLWTTNMTEPFSKERQIAELAVQRATILTKRVFHEKSKGTFSKEDDSPVTVADFGAQALINHAIRKNFPADQIVGEEEASTLRENTQLTKRLWDLVKDAKLEDPHAEALLGGSVENDEMMLDAIDAGRSEGGSQGRFWTVDPVDGTKGFLRGGQYAVCLALIEDGHVKVGVLGCPNLPIDDNAPLSVDIGANQTDSPDTGVLFSAVTGCGAISRPLSNTSSEGNQRISMKTVSDITQATFCESVEAGHSSHGDQAAIAKRLGTSKPSVRMDSQAKYGSIARGAGDIYLRLPVKKDYQEKIWDHAAGDLIVRESGGQVTDADGNRLDFGKGRTLKDNRGVVAAASAIHKEVLEAVKAVLEAKT